MWMIVGITGGGLLMAASALLAQWGQKRPSANSARCSKCSGYLSD